MRLIKIAQMANGAHDNQEILMGQLEQLPDGWAVIPEDMSIPDTFPFVQIETADGVVTSMTAGEIPEAVSEEHLKPTFLDRLEAQMTYTAMMTDTLIGEV